MSKTRSFGNWLLRVMQWLKLIFCPIMDEEKKKKIEKRWLEINSVSIFGGNH